MGLTEAAASSLLLTMISLLSDIQLLVQILQWNKMVLLYCQGIYDQHKTSPLLWTQDQLFLTPAMSKSPFSTIYLACLALALSYQLSLWRSIKFCPLQLCTGWKSLQISYRYLRVWPASCHFPSTSRNSNGTCQKAKCQALEQKQLGDCCSWL